MDTPAVEEEVYISEIEEPNVYSVDDGGVVFSSEQCTKDSEDSTALFLFT
jgi:hypothetical protein